MEWDDGTTYGYDQVYANTQLDGYDAAYTHVPGESPNRTMLTPKTVSFREPVASYYDTARRPWHSPDSSLIESPRNEVNQVPDDTPKNACNHGGIPGPIGKLMDCGCGCRGSKAISRMKSAKDRLVSGDLELNNVYMLFILMLALIVIVNAMNVKQLTKQIKTLTKAATRSVSTGPGPP